MASFSSKVIVCLIVGLITSFRLFKDGIQASAVMEAACCLVIYVFGWTIWSVLVYPFFFSPLRNLPQPKSGSLVLGQFLPVIKNDFGTPQREWMQSIPNDGLIYFRFLFNEEHVLLSSPKALAEVLVHKCYNFAKPDRVRNRLGRVAGHGLLLAEGDSHVRQRKILTPAFHFRHIKNLYPVFWAKSRELANAILAEIQVQGAISGNEKPSIDIGEWASRATLDIIGVAGMGQDFGAIADAETELSTMYRTIFMPKQSAKLLDLAALFIPFPILRRLPLKRNAEVDHATATIRNTAHALIREKREQLAQGGEVGADILAVAVRSGGFTDGELVDQMMTFLAAGHETTATQLTWAVYHLCRHPDAQRRLRDEIRAHLPSPGHASSTVVSAEQIDRLPYLNAVCNETIRLSPAVPITLRVALRDTPILGQVVPAGTIINLASAGINLSADEWGPDASVFNPQRWLNPGCANSGGAKSNYALLTFLHGPRSCIGQSFAKAEFACLLAVLVGSFQFELADADYVPRTQVGLTARPKEGLLVRCTVVGGW